MTSPASLFWQTTNKAEVTAIRYLYLGIFLVACFSIIHYVLYMRLRDAGYKKNIFNFLLVEVPADYLKLSRKHGWSPWPAYLLWLPLALGLFFFVRGVFSLP